MRKEKLISLLVFGYTICCYNKTFGQDCSQILQHGIYNYTATDFYNDRIKSFVNWFKNENIQTYQQAKSSSFDATIPIDDITVGLGYGKGESAFSQLKQFIESYGSQSESEKTKFAQVLQSIEPKIIDAWNNCIQIASKGQVVLWVEPTAAANTFDLCAMYNDIGTGPRTVGELDFDIDPSRIKVNNSVFFNSNKKINKNKPINSSVLRQAITVIGKKEFVLNVSGMGQGLKYSFKPNVISYEPTFERRPANQKETMTSDAAFNTSIVLNRIISKNVMLKIDVDYTITKADNVGAGQCYLAIGDKSNEELEKSPKYFIDDWVNNVGSNSTGTTHYHKSVEVPYYANSERKFFAAPQGGGNTIKTASCKITVTY
jgi:hypothetical protein